MATKAEVVAAGCPDDCCDKLIAAGMDLGKVLAVVNLVVKYIPLVKADPKEMFNFVVELYQVFFPPAPPVPPAPMPAP